MKRVLIRQCSTAEEAEDKAWALADRLGFPRVARREIDDTIPVAMDGYAFVVYVGGVYEYRPCR